MSSEGSFWLIEMKKMYTNFYLCLEYMLLIILILNMTNSYRYSSSLLCFPGETSLSLCITSPPQLSSMCINIIEIAFNTTN